MAFYSLLIHGWQGDKPTIQKLIATMHTGANAFPQATPWFLSAQKQRDYNAWLAFEGALPILLRDQGIVGVIKAMLAQYVAGKGLDEMQGLQQATLLALAQAALADVPAFFHPMTLTP